MVTTYVETLPELWEVLASRMYPNRGAAPGESDDFDTPVDPTVDMGGHVGVRVTSRFDPMFDIEIESTVPVNSLDGPALFAACEDRRWNRSFIYSPSPEAIWNRFGNRTFFLGPIMDWKRAIIRRALVSGWSCGLAVDIGQQMQFNNWNLQMQNTRYVVVKDALPVDPNAAWTPNPGYWHLDYNTWTDYGQLASFHYASSFSATTNSGNVPISIRDAPQWMLYPMPGGADVASEVEKLHVLTEGLLASLGSSGAIWRGRYPHLQTVASVYPLKVYEPKLPVAVERLGTVLRRYAQMRVRMLDEWGSVDPKSGMVTD